MKSAKKYYNYKVYWLLIALVVNNCNHRTYTPITMRFSFINRLLYQVSHTVSVMFHSICHISFGIFFHTLLIFCSCIVIVLSALPSGSALNAYEIIIAHSGHFVDILSPFRILQKRKFTNGFRLIRSFIWMPLSLTVSVSPSAEGTSNIFWLVTIFFPWYNFIRKIVKCTYIDAKQFGRRYRPMGRITQVLNMLRIHVWENWILNCSYYNGGNHIEKDSKYYFGRMDDAWRRFITGNCICGSFESFPYSDNKHRLCLFLLLMCRRRLACLSEAQIIVLEHMFDLCYDNG